MQVFMFAGMYVCIMCGALHACIYQYTANVMFSLPHPAPAQNSAGVFFSECRLGDARLMVERWFRHIG